MEWRPPGLSMWLPVLIFPYTIKSRCALLAPAHPGGPGKRVVKRLWCGGVKPGFMFKTIITVQCVSSLITWRRSWSFAEYWKHFVLRLNDVHALDYNSAGSERIWMKFGALWVYCLELALTDFGRDLHRSESGSASRFFCFFLSGK